MAKILETPMLDIVGACIQWKNFIESKLGFDMSVDAEVQLSATSCCILLRGFDKFQDSLDYGKRIGQLGYTTVQFKREDEWEEIQAQVWERLGSKMRRDERELRYGAMQLSGMIENFTAETRIGQMIHERLVKVRDEMTENLLTYQKEKADGSQN